MNKSNGFIPMSLRVFNMIHAAQRELCKLKGEDYSHEEFKKQIEGFTQYDGLNMLRKLNRQIKKLGGQEIGTGKTIIRKHNC